MMLWRDGLRSNTRMIGSGLRRLRGIGRGDMLGKRSDFYLDLSILFLFLCIWLSDSIFSSPISAISLTSREEQSRSEIALIIFMAFGFDSSVVQVWWLIGVCCLSIIPLQAETSLHMYVLCRPLLEAYWNYYAWCFLSSSLCFGFIYPFLAIWNRLRISRCMFIVLRGEGLRDLSQIWRVWVDRSDLEVSLVFFDVRDGSVLNLGLDIRLTWTFSVTMLDGPQRATNATWP